MLNRILTTWELWGKTYILCNTSIGENCAGFPHISVTQQPSSLIVITVDNIFHLPGEHVTLLCPAWHWILPSSPLTDNVATRVPHRATAWLWRAWTDMLKARTSVRRTTASASRLLRRWPSRWSTRRRSPRRRSVSRMFLMERKTHC